MTHLRHAGLGREIIDDFEQPTLELSNLKVGDTLSLQLMEDDATQFPLVLVVEQLDETSQEPTFRVIGGEVPASIVAKGQRADFMFPEMVGAECAIMGAFTHRPGYIPSMAMFSIGRLTAGRSTDMVFLNPQDRNVGNHYLPFVLSWELASPQPQLPQS